uniref:7TM_GPCR_Srx domain-containing protein n=1 Tax=Angiostrongylus cantonensis TaxID=6313 RepID=A0A158PBV4_ANGCA
MFAAGFFTARNYVKTNHNDAEIFEKPRITIQLHYLLKPFLFTDPCHIFLSKFLYASSHVIMVFIVLSTQFFQIAILIERCVATVLVHDYESKYERIGPSLIAAVITVTTAIIAVLYRNANFEGFHLNWREDPVGSSSLSIAFILMMVSMNLLGLVCTVALRYVNRRRIFCMSLSSRFQSMENRVSHEMLFWILLIQFTTLLFIDITALFIRLYNNIIPFSIVYEENIDYSINAAGF